MKQSDLDREIALWRDRLKFQDWNLSARLVSPAEIGEAVGRIDFCYESRCAAVTLLHPKHYSDQILGSDHRHFLQVVIVHELLHLHFPTIDYKHGSAKHKELERAIDGMAWAFVLALAR